MQWAAAGGEEPGGWCWCWRGGQHACQWHWNGQDPWGCNQDPWGWNGQEPWNGQDLWGCNQDPWGWNGQKPWNGQDLWEQQPRSWKRSRPVEEGKEEELGKEWAARHKAFKAEAERQAEVAENPNEPRTQGALLVPKWRRVAAALAALPAPKPKRRPQKGRTTTTTEPHWWRWAQKVLSSGKYAAELTELAAELMEGHDSDQDDGATANHRDDGGAATEMMEGAPNHRDDGGDASHQVGAATEMMEGAASHQGGAATKMMEGAASHQDDGGAATEMMEPHEPATEMMEGDASPGEAAAEEARLATEKATQAAAEEAQPAVQSDLTADDEAGRGPAIQLAEEEPTDLAERLADLAERLADLADFAETPALLWS